MASSPLKPPPGRHHSTVVHQRRAELRPLPLVVRCHGGGNAIEHRLTEGGVVIGAGAEADVVVDAETVSRRHALVTLVPEGAQVEDLGSKNGLFYLGQRFQSMIVPPGGRFNLGSVPVELGVDQHTLAQREAQEPDRYGDLLGASKAMRELFASLVRLEGSKVNVLILGESGTGKELIARALHEHSPVRRGPLVVVNCGALERNLVRSELFGHERGAFTGAERSRTGAFEAADGGTLFLDEVGELPLDVQPVLLRALEARKVARVGGRDERPVDVRFVAATHRDLESAVEAGEFREDLFYRLRVVRLDVPPLRERSEDVAVLAASFAASHGVRRLPDDFLDVLSRHRWPGNVRELKNAVDAYVAVGALPAPKTKKSQSFAAALADFIDCEQSYAAQKEEVLGLFTRAYFERLLEETSGNQSEAARRSGMQRTYLVKLLGKLGLRRP